MENKCYCTNCSKEMNVEAEICTSCGVRQGKTIHYCENKLQEILTLKEQPIQALLLSQVARITIDTTKKVTGIYLTTITENIYRERNMLG